MRRDHAAIDQIGFDIARSDPFDLAVLITRLADLGRALAVEVGEVYDLTPEEVIDRVIDG
jgi:hypothetical protein